MKRLTWLIGAVHIVILVLVLVISVMSTTTCEEAPFTVTGRTRNVENEFTVITVLGFPDIPVS